MKDIINLKDLTKEQSGILLSIYQNCKTYKIRYKYPGLFQNELCWPETSKEYEWIKDTIPAHFGLTADDIPHVPYTEEKPEHKDKHIVLPYSSQTINFVHYYPEDFAKLHNDKIFFPEGFPFNAKINIPILNAGSAVLQFEESGESSRYPTPILVDTFSDHKVVWGDGPPVNRVFLQIRLKRSFAFYRNKLQWHETQENTEGQ